MAGTTQVWGYKFVGVFDLCHFALISPYSNGAVQIRVGLELVEKAFAKFIRRSVFYYTVIEFSSSLCGVILYYAMLEGFG